MQSAPDAVDVNKIVYIYYYRTFVFPTAISTIITNDNDCVHACGDCTKNSIVCFEDVIITCFFGIYIYIRNLKNKLIYLSSYSIVYTFPLHTIVHLIS